MNGQHDACQAECDPPIAARHCYDPDARVKRQNAEHVRPLGGGGQEKPREDAAEQSKGLGHAAQSCGNDAHDKDHGGFCAQKSREHGGSCSAPSAICGQYQDDQHPTEQDQDLVSCGGGTVDFIHYAAVAVGVTCAKSTAIE